MWCLRRKPSEVLPRPDMVQLIDDNNHYFCVGENLDAPSTMDVIGVKSNSCYYYIFGNQRLRDVLANVDGIMYC